MCLFEKYVQHWKQHGSLHRRHLQHQNLLTNQSAQCFAGLLCCTAVILHTKQHETTDQYGQLTAPVSAVTFDAPVHAVQCQCVPEVASCNSLSTAKFPSPRQGWPHAQCGIYSHGR
jgi:hypothetical protein